MMEKPPTLDPGASALADVLIKQLSQVAALATDASKCFARLRVRVSVFVCVFVCVDVIVWLYVRLYVQGLPCVYMAGAKRSICLT